MFLFAFYLYRALGGSKRLFINYVAARGEEGVKLMLTIAYKAGEGGLVKCWQFLGGV